MKKILTILFSLLFATISRADNVGSLHTHLDGKITNISGEPVIGASIYFPELKTGAVTNIDGVYHVNNLPAKTILFQVSSVGYKMISDKINPSVNNRKDFQLEESVTEIAEVAITGQTSSSRIES